MDAKELDYDLPPELIAQHPAERRDGSRLLVFDRATAQIRHQRFAELPQELSGELVVVNDTKVVPARLHLQRETGGQARCSSSSASARTNGRGSHVRRSAFTRPSGSVRWSCSSRSARDAGACAC